MKTSENGLEMITSFEGIRLTPYLCSAGVPTIGIGSTYYEDGTKVKMSDKKITLERAKSLFSITLLSYEQSVLKLVKTALNQNQFDSLVSFCYNLGSANLKSSTLLKKVNINPNDESIKLEFLKWNKANKKVIKGLTIRRQKEAENYFL